MRIEIKNATIIGMKTPAGQVAGIYHPATATAQARVVTIIRVDEDRYRDRETKELVNPKEDNYLRVTIWNSDNGKMADDFCRWCSIHKKLHTLELDRKPYKRQQRGAGGELLVKADGTPFMVEAVNWVVRRYKMGDDSEKVESAEVALWNGSINVYTRPPFWKTTPDWMVARNYCTAEEVEYGKKAWKMVCDAKRALQFTPGTQYFGYCLVDGTAAAVNPAIAQPQAPPAGFGYGRAGAGPDVPMPQGGPTGPVAPVTKTQQVLTNPLPPKDAAAMLSTDVDIPY